LATDSAVVRFAQREMANRSRPSPRRPALHFDQGDSRPLLGLGDVLRLDPLDCLPDRPVERIEPLPVHLVTATPQHHQLGVLNAAPAVTVFPEVQPQLGEDHPVSLPEG